MPEAKIIRIGGKSTAADTDIMSHMRRLLAQLGLSSDSETVEPGVPSLLRRALANGLRSCNVIVVLGAYGHYGIGGAKETIFKALELPFVPDPQIQQRILHFAKQQRIALSPELEALWMLPQGAEPFPAENGVDSGFAISAGGQCILMLPSSPESFHRMAVQYALPYLARFFGLEAVSHCISCFGMNQGAICDELYGDILKDQLPTVFPTSSRNNLETQLWISACAASAQQAEEICMPVIRRIQQQLGDVAYGLDVTSMEQLSLSLLLQQGKSQCIAESYSSGMLYQLLQREIEGEGKGNIPFHGSYMLASETAEIHLPYRKLRGKEIVSPTGAGMLAEYVRQQGEENALGLSLCLDEPVRQIYAALSDGEQVYFQAFPLPDDCFGNRAAEYGAIAAMKLLYIFLCQPEQLPDGVPVRLAAAGKGFPVSEDPHREDDVQQSGGKIVRRLLILLCAMVFAASSAYLGHYYYQGWNHRQDSRQLEQLYKTSSSQSVSAIPEGYPAEYLSKFAALYAVNPDIKGWLSIDGTDFSYPVVQSDQDTAQSQYYLRRDFEGNYSDHGVPFLDYRADVKEPSDNLVIYGHNMRDGQMFEELLQYKNLSYYQAHPIIRFDSVYEEAQYKVVAMFITNTLKAHGEIFDYHNFINAQDDEEFERFLYSVQIRSILNTGVDVGPGDELLTLSTCSYEFKDARFVVVARKIRDGEDPQVDTTKATRNDNVLYPDIWYTLYKTEKPNVSLMRAILPEADRSITVTNQLSFTQETAPPPELSDTLPLPNGITVIPVRPSDQTDQTDDLSDDEELPAVEIPSSQSSEPPASSSSETIVSSQPSVSVSESSSSSSESMESAVSSSSDVSSSQASGIVISSSLPGVAGMRPSSSTPQGIAGLRPSSDSSEQQQDQEIYEEEEPEENDSSPEYDDSETLSVYYNGSRYTDSAYDIVCKVVAAEMGSANAEALKAQAVAAYTYICYENNRGVSPSVVMKTPTTAVKSAVAEVIGEAVYYNGSLAFTCYHATSAGRTNSSADVWGGSYPYLVSVDSSVDRDAYRFEDTKRISADAVASAVEEQLGIELDGDPADWFEVISYTDGGYNDVVSVGGYNKYYYDANNKSYPITGRVLREAVLGLRSACFEVEYLDSRDEFIFTTYGYGHGVGMSQTGAMLMAEEGADYVEILEHYFPGTTVR